jgi:hypothetical protein
LIDGITRVYNWDEIYNIINELDYKQKNLV